LAEKIFGVKNAIITLMKTIFITGASDGLGFATAQLLLEKGYDVFSLSRSKPTDDRIKHIALDLTDEESIENATKQVLELDAPITALINCAGIMSRFDRTDEKQFSDIVNVYSTNVMGTIYLVNFLLDKIIKDEVDIINVSSTAGTKGSASEPVDVSSKWAMRGYTKSLQELFKGKKSRAISFCPGGMRNKMLEKITGEQLPDPENWMPVEVVANELVKVIETPKQAEISEIIINRK
jgi:3-oxoacyl-[acyl-carrier protein] reductase